MLNADPRRNKSSRRFRDQFLGRILVITEAAAKVAIEPVRRARPMRAFVQYRAIKTLCSAEQLSWRHGDLIRPWIVEGHDSALVDRSAGRRDDPLTLFNWARCGRCPVSELRHYGLEPIALVEPENGVRAG